MYLQSSHIVAFKHLQGVYDSKWQMLVPEDMAAMEKWFICSDVRVDIKMACSGLGI